jgi:hypothetical protein
MRKISLFVLSAALTFAFQTSLSAAQKPPASISVTVTIEGKLLDNTTTQIRDDGHDAYVDGVDGVSAKLGDGFVFNFWPSRGTPVRNVYFNHSYTGEPFSGPVAGSPFPGGTVPPTGWATNPHGGTNPPDPAQIVTPYVPIVNMTVGSFQCVTMFWAFGTGRDLYHNGVANTSDNQSAYAVVTRVTSDQWTIETHVGSGYCPGNLPISMVVHDQQVSKNSTVVVKDGYYYMPFRITLRRK